MSIHRSATRPISDDPRVGEIVLFWSTAGMTGSFDKDPAFDADFAGRFMDAHLKAARRHLDAWADRATGALALLVLLDQFPRNAFRGTARAFATDALALAFARRFMRDGLDQGMPADLRMFFYLPFTHSENVADQEISLRERRALGPTRERKAAEHLAIIRRFGRFPHRNAALGRETTSDEAAYLLGGGFEG